MKTLALISPALALLTYIHVNYIAPVIEQALAVLK